MFEKPFLGILTVLKKNTKTHLFLVQLVYRELVKWKVSNIKKRNTTKKKKEKKEHTHTKSTRKIVRKNDILIKYWVWENKHAFTTKDERYLKFKAL